MSDKISKAHDGSDIPKELPSILYAGTRYKASGETGVLVTSLTYDNTYHVYKFGKAKKDTEEQAFDVVTMLPEWVCWGSIDPYEIARAREQSAEFKKWHKEQDAKHAAMVGQYVEEQMRTKKPNPADWSVFSTPTWDGP